MGHPPGRDMLLGEVTAEPAVAGRALMPLVIGPCWGSGWWEEWLGTMLGTVTLEVGLGLPSPQPYVALST